MRSAAARPSTPFAIEGWMRTDLFESARYDARGDAAGVSGGPRGLAHEGCVEVFVYNETFLINAASVEGRVHLVARQVLAAFEHLDRHLEVCQRNFAVSVRVHVGKGIVEIGKSPFQYLLDPHKTVAIFFAVSAVAKHACRSGMRASAYTCTHKPHERSMTFGT